MKNVAVAAAAESGGAGNGRGANAGRTESTRFAMRRDYVPTPASAAGQARGSEGSEDAGGETGPTHGAAAEATVAERDDRSVDGAAMPPVGEGEQVPWPDDAAEAAFLSDARDRGEPVKPKRADEGAEETTGKQLPSLDSLVERIPSEVRDVLEDLFRAKFVGVKRVPKRVLKE